MTSKKYKVTMVGAGHVGLASAVLTIRSVDVTLLDIDRDRFAKIAGGSSSIEGAEIETTLFGYRADWRQRRSSQRFTLFLASAITATVLPSVMATIIRRMVPRNSWPTTKVLRMV